MERLGAGGGRAVIKNRSDNVWINSVLRYSFGLCWGSQRKHTLCFSPSAPLSCSVCIHNPSPICRGSSPLGVTGETKEEAATSSATESFWIVKVNA